MKKEVTDYKAERLADLKGLEYSAYYLSAAITESPQVFLLALRDVVEAQKGMAKVATQAGVNRENLYKMLSEEGNPRLSSLGSVLSALGLRLVIETEPGISPAAIKAPASHPTRVLAPKTSRRPAGKRNLVSANSSSM
jgi:probable addiction module antidote protein